MNVFNYKRIGFALITILILLLSFFKRDNHRPVELLWVKMIPIQDSQNSHNHFIDPIVVNNENFLFIGNTGVNGIQNPNWNINSINLNTGQIAWQESFDFAERYDNLSKLAIIDSKLIATGIVTNNQDQLLRLVLAYDLTTKATLWEYTEPLESLPFSQPSTNSLVVTSKYVALSGSNVSSIGGRNWELLVLNIEDGSQVWREELNPNNEEDSATKIQIHGDMIFVSGYVSLPSKGRIYLIRSYNIHSGQLIWEHELINDFGANILVSKINLFWIGIQRVNNESKAIVKNINLESGHLIWETTLNSEEGFEIILETIQADELNVFIGGVIRHKTAQNQYIASLNIQNGSINWTQSYQLDRNADNANLSYKAWGTSRNMLILEDFGYTTSWVASMQNTNMTQSFANHWHTIIFNKENGNVIWEELSGNPNSNTIPTQLVLIENQIISVGTNYSDTIIKAYTVR